MSDRTAAGAAGGVPIATRESDVAVPASLRFARNPRTAPYGQQLPEPGSLALVALGAMLGTAPTRRRKNRTRLRQLIVITLRWQGSMTTAACSPIKTAPAPAAPRA